MRKESRWNLQFVAKLFAVNVLFTGDVPVKYYFCNFEPFFTEIKFSRVYVCLQFKYNEGA